MPKAPTATSGKSYAGIKKQAKPVNVEAVWRTLYDQLEASHLAKALKTCEKLLRLDATDALALQTKIQLLVALDRYPEALALLDADEDRLTQAYCLYKTGREGEAQEAVAQLDEEEGEDRAAKLLEAQVSYRLEDYETSRDIFEDLAATVDDESPELADLQTNIAACNAHIDFLSAVPSHLASTSAPAIEKLESAPVGPLIHSNPLFKVSAATVASTSRSAATKTASPKDQDAAPRKPRNKLPKNYDATKQPDEYRWLPMRERPGMAEKIVAEREKARGRNKELTQGGAEPATPVKSGGGGGGGGGGGNKKKKGKK